MIPVAKAPQSGLLHKTARGFLSVAAALAVIFQIFATNLDAQTQPFSSQRGIQIRWLRNYMKIRYSQPNDLGDIALDGASTCKPQSDRVPCEARPGDHWLAPDDQQGPLGDGVDEQADRTHMAFR